ncbi:AEC family transporter [Anaerofustis sp.]|uniref:AEC family transporter n=1 Tax=Anaerofustis sp. TaxID=1872517 RepID=UPI0025B7F3A0|nr:AEC family transporter [Anaerofustis sp.]
MNNFIFSLNATIPIFLIMVIGILLKKLNIINDEFEKGLNKFVFNLALPLLLFQDISSTNFIKLWDSKFVIFCFITTFISIIISYFVSMFFKDKSIQGEFIQSSYRSSASIIGIAFVQNIYGNIGASPLMLIGAVPLYNVTAVIVLSLFNKKEHNLNKQMITKTLRGIITNPIIIGIFLGLIWSLSGFKKSIILNKTLSSLASTATPLGLITIGASFNLKKAFRKIKPALICSVFKLLVFCILFIPFAVAIGYRNDYLVTILVMLGSATTVSSYIMAKNMGHEGTLTSSVVMLTTMFSSVTLTFWIFILKSLSLI